MSCSCWLAFYQRSLLLNLRLLKVAILIRDSFSRAERKLAQDQSGEVLLRKYAEKLLQQISNEMTDYIEKALGRSVQTNDVNVNPDTDQIMFIFTLEGNT